MTLEKLQEQAQEKAGKFTEELKTFRKAHKLNQEKTARILGVARRALSNWETGHYIPSSDTIWLVRQRMERYNEKNREG